MLAIFTIYSVVIIGFGVYVKIQSKRNTNDSLASFLTGGGGLGAFSIAMITATNSMAGGTMVTAPGLTYAIGFSGALIYYAGFLTAAYYENCTEQDYALESPPISLENFPDAIGTSRAQSLNRAISTLA